MGPIDPHQLLKALSLLLDIDGGLKSVNEVVPITNLMKDAKKLVSRCVYVNILRSTKKQDILQKFMEVGGWEVLNSWLVDAKKSENNAFLLEMLRVFKELPVTVDVLKQNNSAKIIKTLSRGENESVKILSGEVVSSWMSVIKYNQKINEKPQKKKKTKESKEFKGDKEVKDNEESKDEKIASDFEKNIEKEEQMAIVEPFKSPDKKAKPGRPKTVKVYQAKSRDLGLDQEACKPLKKPASIEKDKEVLKRIGGGLNKLIQPPEKKIKPVNLIMPVSLTSTVSSSPSPINNNQRGIKLIPPKPRPVHIISESSGFISALDAPAATPVRKKKKTLKPATPTTPPPSAATPKLLFYTDTLETVAELDEKDDSSLSLEDRPDTCETKEDKVEDGEAKDFISDKMVVEENNDDIETPPPFSDIRRMKKRKSVTWADETNLRQFFYFEMDETERVNVNHVQNFGDLKSQEMRRERQAYETAKRLMEDRMIERIIWGFPFLIDLPPPLIEPGINSLERAVQHEREQRVLHEIFFSKESLPDSPYEPDLESVDPEDPKDIPLEDENNPDAFALAESYSDPSVVSSLPPALANLVMSISSQQQTPSMSTPPEDLNKMQNVIGVVMGQGEQRIKNHMDVHLEEMQNIKQIMDPFQGPPPPLGEPLNFHGEHMNFQNEHMNFHNEHMNYQNEHMNFHGNSLPTTGLLGAAPPGFEPLGPPMPGGPFPQVMPIPELVEDMSNFPVQRPRHHGQMRGRGMGRGRGNMMRGRGRGRGGSDRGRGGPDRGRGLHERHRGGPDRGRGGPDRSICRYFQSPTGCRFDDNCSYIHPGVNRPPL